MKKLLIIAVLAFGSAAARAQTDTTMAVPTIEQIQQTIAPEMVQLDNIGRLIKFGTWRPAFNLPDAVWVEDIIRPWPARNTATRLMFRQIRVDKKTGTRQFQVWYRPITYNSPQLTEFAKTIDSLYKQ